MTGFHKRKLQRKKKAQEELQLQLKEERKRLKTEAKDSYKKLVVSSRPIPEVEELLKEEYEEDNVTVKVVELSANKPIVEDAEQSEEELEQSEGEEEDEVPGMELKPKVVKKNEEKKVFRSDRDVKKELKRQATKNVQKSKVFQKKHKMERQKQKKKSLQQKKQNEKFLMKHKKKNRKQRNVSR